MSKRDRNQPELIAPPPKPSMRERIAHGLRDFAIRQAGRADRRAKKRARRLAPPQPTQETVPGTEIETKPRRDRHTMRVTFVATFAGRKNQLASGFKFPNAPPEQVEIFRDGNKWFARASNRQLFKLEPQPTYGCMQDVVAENFDTRLKDWVLMDDKHQPIDPDYVNEDKDGNFTRKEITHVGTLDPANNQPKGGPNYAITACAVEVHVSKCVSTRGRTAPVCKQCRPVWDQIRAAAPQMGEAEK